MRRERQKEGEGLGRKLGVYAKAYRKNNLPEEIVYTGQTQRKKKGLGEYPILENAEELCTAEKKVFGARGDIKKRSSRTEMVGIRSWEKRREE